MCFFIISCIYNTTKNYYKHLIFLNKLLNFFLLIVKKPDVIQKNELYFCNQGSNVIQNQLSKSKHRLKSFVLQACVIKEKNKRGDWKIFKKVTRI
jgi:hypothetical protein